MARAGSRPAPLRRRRARRGQGELLRQEILAAAESLLIEAGDEEAVSIRAVADAVGVTPPAIYLHFETKDDLLFAVCERHFAQLDRLLEEASAHAADPIESLMARGRAYVRFGLDHPGHYRVLFMSRPAHTPEGFQDERLMKSVAFGHLVAAVAGLVDAGVIAGEPVVVAIGLWAAVHGVTSLLISKPRFPWPDVEALVEHVLRVQLEGLRQRPA